MECQWLSRSRQRQKRNRTMNEDVIFSQNENQFLTQDIRFSFFFVLDEYLCLKFLFWESLLSNKWQENVTSPHCFLCERASKPQGQNLSNHSVYVPKALLHIPRNLNPANLFTGIWPSSRTRHPWWRRSRGDLSWGLVFHSHSVTVLTFRAAISARMHTKSTESRSFALGGFELIMLKLEREFPWRDGANVGILYLQNEYEIDCTL